MKPNDKENVQSETRKVGSVEQDMFKNRKQMELKQGWVRSLGTGTKLQKTRSKN